MKRTQNIRTVLRLLNQYVPDSDSSAGNVILYIQDVSAHIDYYILNWNPSLKEFFALVDPLHFDNVLDLEYVPVSVLEDSTLFYEVCSGKKQVHWKKKFKQLLPLKPGISSSR